MISEEWIKENLDFIRFTYPKITQQEVISGSHKAMSKSSMLDKGYRTKAVFKSHRQHTYDDSINCYCFKCCI